MTGTIPKPVKHFQIRRDTGYEGDPCAALIFDPPRESDELYEALKAAYPAGRSHRVRMMEAILEFLMSELVEEKLKSANQARVAVPAIGGKDIPSQNPARVESNAKETKENARVEEDTAGQSIAASSRTTKYRESTDESPPFHEMTSVWNAFEHVRQGGRSRRPMNSLEKAEYRIMRAVGACESCRKRRRKCPHRSSAANDHIAAVAASDEGNVSLACKSDSHSTTNPTKGNAVPVKPFEGQMVAPKLDTRHCDTVDENLASAVISSESSYTSLRSVGPSDTELTSAASDDLSGTPLQNRINGISEPVIAFSANPDPNSAVYTPEIAPTMYGLDSGNVTDDIWTLSTKEHQPYPAPASPVQLPSSDMFNSVPETTTFHPVSHLIDGQKSYEDLPSTWPEHGDSDTLSLSGNADLTFFLDDNFPDPFMLSLDGFDAPDELCLISDIPAREVLEEEDLCLDIGLEEAEDEDGAKEAAEEAVPQSHRSEAAAQVEYESRAPRSPTKLCLKTDKPSSRPRGESQASKGMSICFCGPSSAAEEEPGSSVVVGHDTTAAHGPIVPHRDVYSSSRKATTKKKRAMGDAKDASAGVAQGPRPVSRGRVVAPSGADADVKALTSVMASNWWR